MTDRRAFMTWVAIVAACMGASCTQAQEAYPTKPIRIINPYQAGGIVDILARLLGDKLQRSLGQPIVVEVRAGAGGNVGTAYVAKNARGDPYTLLLGASGPLAPNVTLFKNLGYDPLKDLTPVTLLAATPLVLTVSSTSSVHTFGDLVTLLKTQKEKASFGTAGVGTPQHLSVELMKQQLGLESTHVAYKGAAPAINALLGSEVTFSIDNLVLVLPHVKAGKLRALGVTSPKRTAELPEVPTMQELGLAKYEARGWYGLLAPAQVPDAIIRKLNTESVNAMRQPDILPKLASLGSESVAGSPEDFRNLIAAEISKWRSVILKGGISVD
ncbi:MAG TPA: tripartite tricarboxylate transporter substrate binding protein [Burkholderiales bacterium]|nr:tripartite tricarboxylate transporter substrate binding protein [Burkholderiales bacterium]